MRLKSRTAGLPKVTVCDLRPPMPELVRDDLPRILVDRFVDRRAASYGRRNASQFLIARGRILMPQPMRYDTEVALRNAEPLHYVTRAAQRLFEVQVSSRLR